MLNIYAKVPSKIMGFFEGRKKDISKKYSRTNLWKKVTSTKIIAEDKLRGKNFSFPVL